MTADESAAMLLAADALRGAAAACERLRALSGEQVSVFTSNGMDVPAAFQEGVEAQGGIVSGLVRAADALEKCARCRGGS